MGMMALEDADGAGPYSIGSMMAFSNEKKKINQTHGQNDALDNNELMCYYGCAEATETTYWNTEA